MSDNTAVRSADVRPTERPVPAGGGYRELEIMIRKRMPLAGLTMALAATAGTPALAADTGLYVGAIAGQSRYHQDRGELDAANADRLAGCHRSVGSEFTKAIG